MEKDKEPTLLDVETDTEFVQRVIKEIPIEPNHQIVMVQYREGRAPDHRITDLNVHHHPVRTRPVWTLVVNWGVEKANTGISKYSRGGCSVLASVLSALVGAKSGNKILTHNNCKDGTLEQGVYSEFSVLLT